MKDETSADSFCAHTPMFTFLTSWEVIWVPNTPDGFSWLSRFWNIYLTDMLLSILYNTFYFIRRCVILRIQLAIFHFNHSTYKSSESILFMHHVHARIHCQPNLIKFYFKIKFIQRFSVCFALCSFHIKDFYIIR